MPYILNEYTESNMNVTEFTIDGTSVSHTVKTPIIEQPPGADKPQTTLEELIYAENQYQTALLEINMMGAM